MSWFLTFHDDGSVESEVSDIDDLESQDDTAYTPWRES